MDLKGPKGFRVLKGFRRPKGHTACRGRKGRRGPSASRAPKESQAAMEFRGRRVSKGGKGCGSQGHRVIHSERAVRRPHKDPQAP